MTLVGVLTQDDGVALALHVPFEIQQLGIEDQLIGVLGRVGDMLQGYAGHPAGLIDLGTGGDEHSGQANHDQQGKCC